MQETHDTPSRRPALPTNAGSKLVEAILRHARQRPDAEAVGEADGAERRCTYGELAGLAAAKAACLRARVEPGGVVLALMPGGVDLIAWFCGAMAAGVRLLPLHAQIAGPEALEVARRAGAKAAVVGPEMRAGPALAGLEQLPIGVSGEAALELTLPTGRAGAVVLGSSGTTGLPKLAVRESASLDADAAGVIGGMGLTAADRVVFATPLGHSYGVDVLVAVLTAGATLRVLTQSDAEVLARELERGATVLPGVPFVFEALARRERRGEVPLRLALSAGSPLPARVRAAFAAAWGVEVGQLYGATELGTVAIDAPGSAGFDASSVGRPLPGVSMRVVDAADATRTLGPGEEGQLVVRAPSMLSEYSDGEVPLVDGHFLTGDLAVMDRAGRVHITGRLKMLIDVGAYKVNPLEVEAVLGSHPGVAECVVVPIAASESVQRLRAVVVLVQREAQPTARELRHFLQERLSAIKVPRVVEFAMELPKSPTGKVLRDRV
jgi:acyl-coenzyme A synthetase/AMP-(fatty) acid ligase